METAHPQQQIPYTISERARRFISKRWVAPVRRLTLGKRKGPRDVPQLLVGSKWQKTRTTYTYEELDEQGLEIRLITLLPGKFGADIHARIYREPLIQDSPPKFEALSYTWGTTDSASGIHIIDPSLEHDDVPRVLAVTQNLAEALQYLRYEDRPRTLWVDAICVNQQNFEERGEQVKRMPDIFKLAERVVAWLGPGSDDSHLAIEILYEMGSNIEFDWTRRSIKPSDEAKASGKIGWANRRVALPITPEEALSIYNLFRRPWFERLWIQQEIRLANRLATLKCGADTILWQDFRKAVYCIDSNETAIFDPKSMSKAVYFRQLKLLLQLCNDREYSSISDLLEETTLCRCSDPRDRVFGLLGMLDDTDRKLNITPDYNMSLEEVYMDVILRVLDNFADLPMLPYCQMQSPPSDMASWVPNWSIELSYLFSRGGSDSGWSSAIAERVAERILRVWGVNVGKVKSADETDLWEAPDDEVVSTIRRFAPPNLDPLGGKVFDTYCRMIWNDTFSDGWNPPASHLPSWNECKAALAMIMGPSWRQAHLAAPLHIEYARRYMSGRTFCSTEEGHFGYGPPQTKLGDEIVVFPGCPNLMVLRSRQESRYQVVGGCFIPDLGHAAGLLGPLPEGHCLIKNFVERKSGYFAAFRDLKSGKFQWTDPRFDLFRTEEHEDGMRRIFVREPQIAADYLDGPEGVRMEMLSRESEKEEVLVMGLDLRPFDLV